MEELVEFKIRNYQKYNVKIFSMTYLKETLSTDPVMFNIFIEKYKSYIIENSGCFLFVDSRNVKNVDFEYLWSKVSDIVKLDELAKKHLCGTVYIVNNPFFKTMGNSIFKIYPPVVPTKICKDNEESMKFMNSVLEKKNKKK